MTPTELKALQDHTDALNRTRDTELQRIAAIEAQTEAMRAYLTTVEAAQRDERKPHRYTEATVWLNAYCAAIQARRPEPMSETADNAVKRFKTRFQVED